MIPGLWSREERVVRPLLGEDRGETPPTPEESRGLILHLGDSVEAELEAPFSDKFRGFGEGLLKGPSEDIEVVRARFLELSGMTESQIASE